MVALAMALALGCLQETEVMGPPIPPEAAVTTEAAHPPAPAAEESTALIPLPRDDRTESPRLVETPDTGPSLGAFLLATGVVLVLLAGTFALLRRFSRGSRLLGGGGAINVVSRRALNQKQEIYLVEVGTKVFLVGATRDRLNTLGEFSDPDEVAGLRASAPRRKEDSMALTFRNSLREGLREEETKPSTTVAFSSIADELAEIRKTVRTWRA